MKAARLNRFVRRLQLLRLLLLALINGVLVWAALVGPLQDRIGTSLGATLGFCLLVVVIPWVVVEAFPAPAVFRPGRERPADWLFRERAKTVALILVTATLIGLYLEQTRQPLWEGLGILIVCGGLMWCAWICRRSLRDGWRQTVRAVKGEDRGGGWSEAWEQLRRFLRRPN
jgi:hypothetical protein